MAHAHDHAHDHDHDHGDDHDHDHGDAGDKPPIPLAVETADAGPCEKKLTITVEATAVQERLSHALRDLRGTVALPGFRRGHAPKKLLERRFQERIQEEVRTALMEDWVKQVVEGQKWTLMGPVEWHTPETPRALSGDAPFSFEVTVEIRPSVVLPNYASIEVKRPPATVAPEEVEAEVVKIRQERAEWVPVASGGAQAHDMVVFDATFHVEGAEVHASTGASAVLPGANEGFAKGYEWVGKLAAAKSGDTITHRGTLPADLPNAEARGKDGEIRVTVRAVKRQELPPLDAEWLQALGAPSEEALRAKLGDLLQKARDRDADAALEDQILDQILERTPIELPRRLVERETEAYLQRYEMALRGKRIEAAEIPKLLEEARQERRGQVERGIRRYLLLDEIAGREKIFVTEDDVAARLAEMAAHYEKTVPAIEAELESRGLMRDLRSQLKEEKVRAFVRGKAKVSA